MPGPSSQISNSVNTACLLYTSARYLAEKKIRLLGTESINVDKTGMESHRILLGNGVIIVENICRLEQIGADRCRIFGTFPAVRGASGTWVRLLALV